VFVVSGSTPPDTVSQPKATAKEAITLGLELMGKGFQSVYITSPDGVYWGPQQFTTLLVTHGEKPRRPGS
jgi:hypothetical protein